MIHFPFLSAVKPLVLAWSALALCSAAWGGSEYLPARLIVDFDPSVKFVPTDSDGQDILRCGVPSLDTLFRQFEVRSANRLVPDGILSSLKTPPDLFHTYVLQFGADRSVPDVRDRFAAHDLVRSAVPDALQRVFRTPNDPLWSSQWDKRLVGANSVWDLSVGSRDIICAGIDVGVDWNHPDLTPSLWVNPGEDVDGDGAAWSLDDYPGDIDDINGVDDDGNGLIDDLLGWDFIAGLRNCAPGEDCDSHGDNNVFGINSHGTHVAGIMVAAGNNGVGVTGMSWNGRLMALRAGFQAMDGEGYIPESASIPAILYAAAKGARIINMSFGGPGWQSGFQQVMNSAFNQGCLLFAASGNEASDQPQYPAAYDNVIAVNATDWQDHLAWWSNRGQWTDLCAPGSDPGIWSTVIDGYDAFWGTSMASPNAAGVAALLWSIFPDWTNSQIRDLVLNSAQDISAANPGIDPLDLGHGRVDALDAVVSLCPMLDVTDAVVLDAAGGDGDGRLEAGESASLTFTVVNRPGWAAAENVTVSLSSSDPQITVTDGEFTIDDLGSGQTFSTTGYPVGVALAAGVQTSYLTSITVRFQGVAGYVISREIVLRVGRGRVLLVDDDGDAGYEQYYVSALSGIPLSSETWAVSSAGEVSRSELDHYPVVLWICGDRSSQTITSSDQANLAGYLDQGGDLILVGQNIDEDLRDVPFYADYLHVQSAQAAGNPQLTGVPGNPVSNGMSLILTGTGCAGNGTLSPSRIEPLSGATTLFEYTQGGVGAVLYSGAYKLAYFAFALEAACGASGTTRYDAVLAAVLNWMTPLDAPTRQPAGPDGFRLVGNYPNPFNASTTIIFDLAAPSRVRLTVFNMLGRRVADLTDAPFDEGVHRVTFDGSHLPSGVYLAQLEAGALRATTKLVLVK